MLHIIFYNESIYMIPISLYKSKFDIVITSTSMALIMAYLPLLSLLILLHIPLSASIPATNITLEHLDPTLPPALTGPKPKCSVLVLQHEFAHTVGLPPTSTNYTHPPDCPGPWTRIVLELSAVASDAQKDRIAGVWANGVELLRTSTPLSMAAGTFWKVQKDVTRYNAVLRMLARGEGFVTMMLQNSNTTLPGEYFVNVTLHFYRGPVADQNRLGYTSLPTVKGLYRQPADLIIPISQENGYCCSEGFWFRINNGSHTPTVAVAIPRNTYRAVLEIFSSYHENDETWYENPLRSEYEYNANKLNAGRSNGGFRQVFATIDGQFIGGHIPFPVIYPRSINPYFWSPVAAIGAFDMPSYDLDVTPFLGLILDGQPHEIGIGVKDAQSHWLVTGNLHVWVDVWSDAVQGGLLVYEAPEVKLNRHAEWRNEDGSSEIDGEGLVKFVGWVSSSRGNLTTMVRQKIKFKNQVEVHNGGAVKQVEMINKERMTVSVTSAHQIISRVQLFTEAPLQIQSSVVKAIGGATFEKTRMYHQLEQMLNLNENQLVTSSSLIDRQDAEGSALMHYGSPLWGSGNTKSYYKYRDDRSCYLRSVNTEGGVLKFDIANPSCLAFTES